MKNFYAVYFKDGVNTKNGKLLLSTVYYKDKKKAAKYLIDTCRDFFGLPPFSKEILEDLENDRISAIVKNMDKVTIFFERISFED